MAALDFVIIGAQKGGSTALAHAIAQHPDIWMPSDEVNVFRDPIFSNTLVRDFLAHVENERGARVAGIKCPDYLGRNEVPLRLRDDGGSPKLIACLRDPVSRAISSYFWHVRWGLLPLENAEIGMAKVLDGDYSDIDPTAAEILEWGNYAKMLEHYYAITAADQLHVLLADDIRKSPGQAYAALFRFLGVRDDFCPVNPGRSSNEGVYNKRRLKLLRLRNRYVLCWDDSHSYATLPPATRAWPKTVSKVVAGVDHYILRRFTANDPPTLSPELEQRLRRYYLPDVLHLEQLLSRDLQSWRLGA